MTDERIISGDELMPFMNGNLDAVQFCLSLIYLAHLWDDLVDRDKPRTNEEINNGFMIALINIPTNKFYVEHQRELIPLMKNAIFQWISANDLEKGNDDERCLSFMMRNELLHVLSYCLYLTGGYQWMKEKELEFRKLCAKTMKSKLIEFMGEAKHA